MELIKIDEVDYDYNYDIIPSKGEVYINLDFISVIEKRYKKTAKEKGRYIYAVQLKTGREILISEACYNRIVGKRLPSAPQPKPIGERPARPKLNIGEPF